MFKDLMKNPITAVLTILLALIIFWIVLRLAVSLFWIIALAAVVLYFVNDRFRNSLNRIFRTLFK